MNFIIQCRLLSAEVHWIFQVQNSSWDNIAIPFSIRCLLVFTLVSWSEVLKVAICGHNNIIWLSISWHSKCHWICNPDIKFEMNLLEDSAHAFILKCKVKTKNVFWSVLNLGGLIRWILNSKCLRLVLWFFEAGISVVSGSTEKWKSHRFTCLFQN